MIDNHVTINEEVVLDALKGYPHAVNPATIASAMGADPQTVRKVLIRLTATGQAICLNDARKLYIHPTVYNQWDERRKYEESQGGV